MPSTRIAVTRYLCVSAPLACPMPRSGEDLCASIPSYGIRESALSAPEEESAADENENRQRRRDEDHLRSKRAASKYRPARALDECNRRVQAVEKPILLRNERRRISHG